MVIMYRTIFFSYCVFKFFQITTETTAYYLYIIINPIYCGVLVF